MARRGKDRHIRRVLDASAAGTAQGGARSDAKSSARKQSVDGSTLAVKFIDVLFDILLEVRREQVSPDRHAASRPSGVAVLIPSRFCIIYTRGTS